MLLYWALLYDQQSFLGVQSVQYESPSLTTYTPVVMPIWLCVNMSVLDTQNMNAYEATNKRYQDWMAVFDGSQVTATFAKYDVYLQVGTAAFEASLYQQAIVDTLKYASIAGLISFVFLIWIFTNNLTAVLLNTIHMFSISILVVVTKLWAVSTVFDVYDLVLLFIFFPVLVSLQVYFFFHFFNDSDYLKVTYFKPEMTPREQELDWNLFNSIISTQRYHIRALLFPFLVLFSIGLYLLYCSQFLPFQRMGVYLLIISLISTAYVLIIYPLTLGLSHRFESWDKYERRTWRKLRKRVFTEWTRTAAVLKGAWDRIRHSSSTTSDNLVSSSRDANDNGAVLFLFLFLSHA